MQGKQKSGSSVGRRIAIRRVNVLLAAATVTAALGGSQSYAGTNGTWALNGTSGGLWGTATNWTGSTIATGTDAIATFTTPTVANTVSLDTNYTIGQLNFSNTSTSLGWTINGSGKTLTLATSTGQPVINAVGATDTISAAVAGNQGFIKTGSGQFTFAPSTALTGTVNDSAGLITSSGGTFSGSLIGTGAFSCTGVTTLNTGNLTAYAGTMTSSYQFSINSPATGGIFTGTSASAAYVDNVTGTNGFILTPNGTGTVFTAATANLGSLSGVGEIRGGNTAGCDGLLTISEGALNTSTTFSGVISNNTAAFSSNSAAQIVMALTKVGTGTLSLTGTGSNYGGPTNISNGAIAAASLAVEGTAGGVGSSIGASNNSASNLVFSGGTLIYTGATATTDRNFTISPGVQADFNVSTSTTSLTVSGSAVTTTGGITKDGPGTLILTGSHTYTGPTLINAGTLLINSPGSLSNTSAITLSSNAVFGGTGTVNSTYNQTAGTLSAGAVGAPATFNLTSGATFAGGTLSLNLYSSSVDPLSVAGTLNLAAPTILSVPTLSTAGSGPFELIDYPTGSLTGSLNNLVLGARGATLSTGASNISSGESAIYLTISGATTANLNWNSSSSSSFDVLTSKNWLNTGSGSQDYYYQGDTVNFTDGPGLQPNIAIVGSLTPSAVNVSSNSINYNFSGSGTLSGPTGLTMTGTSVLTISNNNTFTGTANIASGSVVAAGTGSLGAGPLVIGSAATVTFGTGTTAGTVTNSSVVDNGSLNFNHSDNYNPPAISGNGSVTVSGSGGLAFSPSDTYGGGTYLLAGTSYLTQTSTNTYTSGVGNNSLGTGPVNINGGTLTISYYVPSIANNFNLSGNALHVGFQQTAYLTGSVNLTGATTLACDGGAGFAFSGPNFNTQGNSLTLSYGNGLTIATTAAEFSAASTITTTSDTLTLAPPSGSNYSIPSIVAGNGTLTMSGPGNATLSGSNTYSGGTTVAGGTLIAANSNALGPSTAAVSFSGGANVTGELALPGGINISNPISVGGRTGTFAPYIDNISGNNTVSSTINLYTSGNEYAIQSDAGLLTISGQITQAAGTGARYYLFQGAGNGLVTSPLVNGTAVPVVVVNGPGTWTFSGNNSYGGYTQVSGGTLVLAPNYSSGIQTVSLSGGLNISTGGLVQVAAALSHATRSVVTTSALNFTGSSGNWGGTLDLANNDLDIQNGILANVWSQVAQGYNSAAWNGSGGIVSSSAQNDPSHLTTLGVIQNSVDQNGGSALAGTFDGLTVSNTDVLVKFTYYGDTNLDGHIDGTDYSRIDNGVLNQLTGWFNGDFNYDGVINGSDYTLIDNAYNTQGASLADEIASPTAQIAGSGATSAVPEPASLSVMALAAAGLLGRRRR